MRRWASERTSAAILPCVSSTGTSPRTAGPRIFMARSIAAFPVTGRRPTRPPSASRWRLIARAATGTDSAMRFLAFGVITLLLSRDTSRLFAKVWVQHANLSQLTDKSDKVPRVFQVQLELYNFLVVIRVVHVEERHLLVPAVSDAYSRSSCHSRASACGPPPRRRFGERLRLLLAG